MMDTEADSGHNSGQKGFAMRHVPIAEFKDKMSEIVAAAEAGEEIIITRHGKAAVRLVAIDDHQRAKRQEAVDRLFKTGQENLRRHGPTSIDELIAWKNEGRP
jgi:prevent-host-death family protein